MLNLQKFLQNNPTNWEEILLKEYKVRISRSGEYVIFNYLINADFSNPIVKECRGIIFHEPTWKPVCVPFFKFGNFQENYADNIDWNSAKALEKIDGSLIKLWWHKGEWHISTNGTIDAASASLCGTMVPGKGESPNNFRELFELAYRTQGVDFIPHLSHEYTYMFELVSPFNKVVIEYSEPKLYFLGARNINTLKEEELDIGVEKPKTFSLSSLSDCIDFANRLDIDHEGLVVVDKFYNRIKVKNPVYVLAHHFIGNVGFTYEKLLDVVLTGDDSEFLGYFPAYKEMIESIKESVFNIYSSHIEFTKITQRKFPDNQKEFALEVLANKNYCSALVFSLQKKMLSWEDFLKFCSVKQSMKNFILSRRENNEQM